MHHPTHRTAYTTAFVTPVVDHWLKREIAQWVHHERSIRRPVTPWSNVLTTELHLAPHFNGEIWIYIYPYMEKPIHFSIITKEYFIYTFQSTHHSTNAPLLFYLICMRVFVCLSGGGGGGGGGEGGGEGGGGSRCSSVVRAFAHGAMGHRIDPSWWTHWAISRSSVTKAVVCGVLYVGKCI